MSEATRIAVRQLAAGFEVRVQMRHPMHNGRERDASGFPVPAWYITEAVVSLNGQEVLRADFGVSVARDPYLRFRLAAVRSGDQLEVRWRDNRGDERSDATLIA